MRVLKSISVFSLVLLMSCKKEGSSPAPILSNPNTASLADFFVQHHTTAQGFTVDASVSQTITCNKGSKITIPSQAFITKLGNVVSGNVEISVTELVTKKEMILSQAQSMTNTDLLVTAGEIKLVAKQNGQELLLYPGKKILLKLPAGTNPSNNMKVHYGTNDFVSSQLFWQMAVNSNSALPISDTNNVLNPYYYSFNSDSLNWVACSEVYSSPAPKTTLTITVHGNYNKDNTKVFLVFPNLKSMAQLNPQSSQLYTNPYTFPIGMNMTIVAVARINGKFYSSFTNAAVLLNHLQDINLSETTEEALLNKLGTL